MNSELFKILEENLGEGRIKVDEPMGMHTTYRIGGPAEFFYEARNNDEIGSAVGLCRSKEIPYFILGGGSNLLVGDKGIRGMVIRIASYELLVIGSKMRVNAGVSLAEVVQKAADAGLTGLEFAVGIPGTFGGAVVGNAGAWQQAIGDKITKVYILTSDGEDKWLDQKECGFSYRQSRFKKSGEIVLEAEMELAKRGTEEMRETMKNNLEKRGKQPKEPSAGSVFVNPKPQAAGVLIDSCGLKGHRIGGAMISPLHANFIINTGLAKCKDVLELIDLCQKKVKEKFGIELEREIKVIGEI